MSLLTDLRDWLEDNPPADMPYWPGARTTQAFGLRTVIPAGTSPLHLGVDRAGDQTFIMPFDGVVMWRLAPGVAGSVLSLMPHDIPLEIQVFHTEADTGVSEITDHLHKGDALPVKPGQLGLSYGVHTHTEVLMPYDNDLRDWLWAGAQRIVNKGAANAAYMGLHCKRHKLNYAEVYGAARKQVDDWWISEMTDRFAVRDKLPEYRVPEWGAGRTLHIDSRWLLRI